MEGQVRWKGLGTSSSSHISVCVCMAGTPCIASHGRTRGVRLHSQATANTVRGCLGAHIASGWAAWLAPDMFSSRQLQALQQGSRCGLG